MKRLGNARRLRSRSSPITVLIPPLPPRKESNVDSAAFPLLFLILFPIFFGMLGRVRFVPTQPDTAGSVPKEEVIMVEAPPPSVSPILKAEAVRFKPKTNRRNLTRSPSKTSEPHLPDSINESAASRLPDDDTARSPISEDTIGASQRGQTRPSFLAPSLDFTLERGFAEWSKIDPPSDSSQKAKFIELFGEYWSQVEKAENYDEFERQMRNQGNFGIGISEFKRLFKPKTKKRTSIH